MKPEEFKAMLEKSLKQQGVPTKQWEVNEGLTDLTIQVNGKTAWLRVVRTSPAGGEAQANPDARRPDGEPLTITREDKAPAKATML